jgi:hypothetical protein
VYLSLVNVFASDNCNNDVGVWPRTAPDILTLASTNLYTMRGRPFNGIPFPLNFDDFNDPVPFRFVSLL